MRVDLRVKHDIEARKAAIGLFERGHGSESAAKALSVPRDTVRQWLYVYRSFGSEVLLSMDGKQTRYTYEQKVAAASAVKARGTLSLFFVTLLGRSEATSPLLTSNNFHTHETFLTPSLCFVRIPVGRTGCCQF